MANTVIVSGGTRGLGRALSLAFGGAGYEVVALYRERQGAADALTAEFAALGISGRCIRLDVSTDDPGLAGLAPAGALTLINNACSPFVPKPMHLTDYAEVERAVAVSVGGAWRLTRALLPTMVRQRQGTIVNVLSTVLEGEIPKGFSAYGVAKAALGALTQSLAVEYRGRGLRIFSVSPGFMDTELTQAWDPALRRAVAARAVRVLAPDEVARRVLELVESSDTAGTGEGYRLDGAEEAPS